MLSPGDPSSIGRWLCHIPIGTMAVLNLGSAYSLADVPTDLLDALGAGNALVVGTWINGIVVSPMPDSSQEY